MSNNSWRHHNLPIFYFKGFTNESNKFLIYDVKRCRFIRDGKEFCSKSYFFEVNANTLTREHNIDAFLETKNYASLDDKVSKLFEKINSSNADNRFSISEDYMPLLQCFVNLMYLRLPHRNIEIEAY